MINKIISGIIIFLFSMKMVLSATDYGSKWDKAACVPRTSRPITCDPLPMESKEILKPYELPDGRIVNVGPKDFRAKEVMYDDPKLNEHNEQDFYEMYLKLLNLYDYYQSEKYQSEKEKITEKSEKKK